MARVFFQLVLVFVTSCTFSACSFLDKSKSLEKVESPTPPIQDKKQISPIKLKVVRAIYELDKLNVRVSLGTLTELSSEGVHIAIKGLKKGEVVEEYSKTAKQITGQETLKVGQEVFSDFTLTTPGISEFQVSGSWGVEKEEESPIFIEKPVIEDIVLESSSAGCKDLASCDKMYTVNAKLRNPGKSQIKSIALAVGIYWANDGESPKLPSDGQELLPNEEILSLGEMVLNSNEAKQLKVAIDQKVPTVPGGKFIPNIRVLSYEAH